MRKLPPKEILSNMSLESKDYIYIQFACNQASSYIFNLTNHQLCFLANYTQHHSTHSPNSHGMLFPICSKWYECPFLLHFTFISCSLFKALSLWIPNTLCWWPFPMALIFIPPAFCFSLFCMSERIMNNLHILLLLDHKKDCYMTEGLGVLILVK